MIYLDKTTAVQVVVIPRNGGRLPYTKPDYIVDAPKDGKTYGRKDGSWAEVTGGGSVDAYTKEESDARFASKSGTYTKTEVDAQLAGKANSSDVYTKSEVYTQAEVRGELARKADDTEVVHKAGAETITGQKTFSAGIKAGTINIPTTNDGVTMAASEVDADNGKVSIVGDAGSFTFEVERDPLTDMEVATKGYVDGKVTELEEKIGEVGGFSKKMIREQFLALSTYFANNGVPTYYGAYDVETDTFKYGKRRDSNEYRFDGLTYEEVATMIAQRVKMSEFGTGSAPCQSLSGVAPLIVSGWWNANWQGGFSGQYAFALCQTKYIFIPYPAGLISSLNGTFNRCVNLEAVYTSENQDTLSVANIASTNAPFAYCSKLKYIHLARIKVDVSFSDSPLLQEESVAYMIRNAQTTAITITLHADAYARAMADADVQTALASKTNVTLASA